MSRANLPLAALMMALLASPSGCASQPKLTAEEKAAARAAEAEMKPATAEEKAAANRADPLTKANFWSKEFTKDPEDLQTAISFGAALRALGSHQRAIDVISQALIVHPDNPDLLMIIGRAFVGTKDQRSAAQAFYRTTEVAPDRAEAWAALGMVYDQVGDHRNAQAAYVKALAIEPARTATLTNYGLSLALSGDLTGAEAQLRAAAANPDADTRVKENLALVLGLQGRFDEMKAASADGAPADVVEENVALLQELIAPARSWDALTAAAETGELPPEPKLAPVVPAPAPVTGSPDKPASPLTLRRKSGG